MFTSSAMRCGVGIVHIADLSSYATEVHQADFEVNGDEDIVRKITRDLSLRGLRFSERQVRDKLRTYHREALRQVAVTD